MFDGVFQTAVPCSDNDLASYDSIVVGELFRRRKRILSCGRRTRITYQIDPAAIHVSHRPIRNHWDFIYNDISSRVFSDDRGSRGSGLIGLPKSAALARTTKELLEGDFFDNRDRGVEWFVSYPCCPEMHCSFKVE